MEIWEDIKDFEGLYRISNRGRIKTVERIIPYRNIGRLIIDEKIMKQKITKDGYFSIILVKDRKKHYFRVHRLIAKNFIENPKNKPFVNHIDGNKLNNSLENLEWCTQSENSKHCYDIGLRVNPHRKKVVNIETGEIFLSIDAAAKTINLCNAALSKKLSGKSKNNTELRYYEQAIN